MTCPDCGAVWLHPLAPCPGCGLAWDDEIEEVAAFLDRLHPPAFAWPPGILSRVSREAYNAVGRARAFPHMTPQEREAAARSYDRLGGNQ